MRSRAQAARRFGSLILGSFAFSISCAQDRESVTGPSAPEATFGPRVSIDIPSDPDGLCYSYLVTVDPDTVVSAPTAGEEPELLELRIKLLANNCYAPGSPSARLDSVYVSLHPESLPAGTPVIDSIPPEQFVSFYTCEEMCFPWYLDVLTDENGEVRIIYQTSGVPGVDALTVFPYIIDVADGPIVTARVHTKEPGFELNLDRTDFEPVLARCFDAVTQQAFIHRRCSQPASRSDRTDGEARVVIGGQTLSNIEVELHSRSIEPSGGHSHDIGTRPSGNFVTGTGSLLDTLRTQTDMNGSARFVYQTSGIGGQEVIIARAFVPDGAGGMDTLEQRDTLDVRWPSLIAMPREGDAYEYKLQSGGHGTMDNRYVQVAALNTLINIFSEYFTLFPAQERFVDDGRSPPGKFVITDAGLHDGGLYDINSTWRNPHQFHRTGEDFDVRISNIPLQNRRSLEDICDDFGARCDDEGDHYHVYVNWTLRRNNQFGEE